MITLDIEALHDSALRYYVRGRYGDAQKAWQEVLVAAPEDGRAVEGLRLIEILKLGRTAGDDAPSLSDPLDVAIEKVRALIDRGRCGTALVAAKAVSGAHPESDVARALTATAMEKYEAGPFIARELGSARLAAGQGDMETLRRACGRVLAMDPDNAAASALMRGEGAAMVAPSTVSDDAPRASEDLPGEVMHFEPAAETGSLFDPGDLDETQPIPLSSTTEEESFADGDRAPEIRESCDDRFADLEEEIHESIGTLEGAQRGEEEDPARDGSGRAGEFAFVDEIPAPEPAADDWTTPATTGAEAAREAGEESHADPRVEAFVREARSLLAEGRYSEAIETASRAFVLDVDAPGAQEVIDDARARVEESDRQTEEHLYNARKLVEEGDEEAAEALLREVLRAHPGHREAVDMLEEIQRMAQQGIEQLAAAPASVHADGPPKREIPELAPIQLARDTEEIAQPRSGPAFARHEAGYEAADRAPLGPIPAAPVPVPGRTGPWLYRLIFYGVLVLLLTGGVVLALRLLPRFCIGSDDVVVGAPPISRAPRAREVIKVPVPAAGGTTTPAPGPVQTGPAAGAPRTLASAREMAGQGKLDEARLVLVDLVRQNPGDHESVEMLQSVAAKITEREKYEQVFGPVVSAFKQERYEDALRILYRLPQDAQKGEIERFKRNAWYNSSIVYLCAGNGTEALRCLKEALEIDPSDAEAKRLAEYARGYSGRDKDAAYYARVEALPKREMDTR
jgi:tetratricopeptide (TPR) repeat protein